MSCRTNQYHHCCPEECASGGRLDDIRHAGFENGSEESRSDDEGFESGDHASETSHA